MRADATRIRLGEEGGHTLPGNPLLPGARFPTEYK